MQMELEQESKLKYNLLGKFLEISSRLFKSEFILVKNCHMLPNAGKNDLGISEVFYYYMNYLTIISI